MAIQYEQARRKVNELSRCATRIVDMLVVLERGALIDTPLDSVTLTAAQISGLHLNLESEGDALKIIAGEIKKLIA